MSHNGLDLDAAAEFLGVDLSVLQFHVLAQ